MKITAEEVAHVAKLARLKLSPEQTTKLTGQMNDILSAMDKLREVDTSEVTATSHALELTGAFRADEVKASLEREQSLENAPATDGESFVVPRVI